MDDQFFSPFTSLDCQYSYADEVMEELKRAVLYAALEIDKTIESANEEIASRELEIVHIRSLLCVAISERDEAISRYRALLSENKPSKTSINAEEEASIEDPSTSYSSLSPTKHCPGQLEIASTIDQNHMKKPLPEKGKLLQAVMEAGPLLQTLLLAGPLPQWQCPPPKINYSDIPIPPLAFSPRGTNKRALDTEPSEGFDKLLSSPKLQKMDPHTSV